MGGGGVTKGIGGRELQPWQTQGSCITNYSVHQLLSSDKLDLRSVKRCRGGQGVQPLPLAVKIC